LDLALVAVPETAIVCSVAGELRVFVVKVTVSLRFAELLVVVDTGENAIVSVQLAP
jgi:hypothetical protein